VDRIDILIAREEIKELKSCYFRATDAHDYELFGSLFTEDAVFESGEFGGPTSINMSGREAIIAGTKAASGGAVKIHHGHNCEISFPEAGRAEGIWSAEYRFFEGEPRKQTRHSFVYYYEDYLRVGDRWLISRLRLLHIHSMI